MRCTVSEIILIGFGASLGAGLVTGIGAIPVLFNKRGSPNAD